MTPIFLNQSANSNANLVLALCASTLGYMAHCLPVVFPSTPMGFPSETVGVTPRHL